MAAERQITETAISAGASWSEIARRDIPDHQIARILTFLGSSAKEDIVHTSYHGDSEPFDEMDDIAERLVLVGADGGGRRLRRKKFDVSADELGRDFDAIYLCEALVDAVSPLRYVVIDIQAGGEDSPRPHDAVLMCKRGDFQEVYAHLGIGGSGGALWRGAAAEDQAPILALDERDYVFDARVVADLVHETVDFLQGEVAARLREWGVPAKHGIILYGEPGNGKTVLTRLCAKHVLEAHMNVVIIEGRRQSARSWDRDVMGLGDQLRRAAARGPALLILEDIDLHCERRPEAASSDQSVQRDERPELAEVLDFLDGFDRTDGYVLVTSTNDLDRLDPALRRAGRIDRAISIEAPDVAQRLEALKKAVASGPKPAPNPERAAGLLDGVSFADLAEVARRYKMTAAIDPDCVTQEVFEEAAEDLMRERSRITTSSAREREASE